MRARIFMYTTATRYINPFVRVTIDPLQISQHTCDFDFTVVYSTFQVQVPTTKTVKNEKKIGNEYSEVLFTAMKKNIITKITDQQSTHYILRLLYGETSYVHIVYFCQKRTLVAYINECRVDPRPGIPQNRLNEFQELCVPPTTISRVYILCSVTYTKCSSRCAEVIQIVFFFRFPFTKAIFRLFLFHFFSFVQPNH